MDGLEYTIKYISRYDGRTYTVRTTAESHYVAQRRIYGTIIWIKPTDYAAAATNALERVSAQ